MTARRAAACAVVAGVAVVAAALPAGCGSCGSRGAGVDPRGASATATGDAGSASDNARSGSDAGIVTATTTTAAPVLLVVNPGELTALEDAGLRAGAVAFDAPDARSNADLAKSTAYNDVVTTLENDLRSLYAKDKAWGPGMRFTHRGFDTAWLRSPDARFELVAVVNRVDRRAFDSGTCGEVRLIYRLAYTTTTKSGPFSSRLPATLNVVYFLPRDDDGCRTAAARFARPLRADLLSASSLAARTLKSVEIDVQTARWPSTVRPDLGGHADYVLRVFHRSGAHLVEAPLENTPDVDKLRADPKLRASLVEWLAANLDALDAGTLVVPERFLAMRAVSVTPRGLARPQNRPWTRALDDADLAPLLAALTTSTTSAPPPPRNTITTRAALLRRLDGLTCMGCHQSRSVAGFHIVGAERPASETGASETGGGLALGISPHLEEDLPRRRAYVDALMRNTAVDERRRSPEHEIDRGGFGDSCGLGDAGFALWTCAAGFHCAAVDDDVVGQCMPDEPKSGSACHIGAVDFAHDRIAPKSAREIACAASAFCEDVGVGFPGGMCAADCDRGGDHSACGAIAQLTPFNDCLARGELFSICAQHATPAALRSCGANDPCRPDYLCASRSSSSSLSSANAAGVCLPPYFVLQMRVDGHPLH